MSRNYQPNMEVMDILIMADYDNVIKEIIDNLDTFNLEELMIVSLEYTSIKTIKMLLTKGVHIDIVKLTNDVPANKDIEWITNVLIDNNYKSVEITEILKRLIVLQ